MDEVEYIRLEAWYNRYADEPGDYHPEAHWLFACHAAFPVLLTPGLLYQLWLNFRTIPNKNGEIKYIPYMAVSDLLLSDLVKEVSAGMYEMSPGIRFALLQYLQQTPVAGGPGRVQQIADFIQVWTAECLTGTDERTQAFRETQQWAIEVYLNPDFAIRQVYDDLQKAYEKQDTHAQLRLNTRLENLDRQYKLRLQVNPETDYASRLEHLLNYSRGTKNLLYDRTEAAITAFSRIPEPDLQKSGKGTAPGGLLTIPREVGGKLRREKQGPGHDGEQIYALLIGIDEYENAGIPRLNGCVNDVRAMAAYLRKYHSDKDLRILTLTNQEATYENVVQNFREHFRLAGPEDVVFIYFAGHADLPQVYLKGKEISSPQEPGLVCYNSTRTGDGKMLYNHELVNLLDEAGKNQPHMAIAIDSNFGSRMTKTVSQPGISKYILLSATYDDRESANETQIDGKTGGLFTRSLLQILELHEGNISYGDLLLQTQTLVKNRTENQTPAVIPINGFDTNLGFLGKILPETKNFNRYQVSWSSENGWELAAGVLEGLKSGDRLQIIEGPEVSFEVRVAGLQTSQLSLYGELPEDEARFYYAEKNSVRTDGLRIQADKATQEMIGSLGLEVEKWVYFVGPYDEAECFVEFSDGKIKIRGQEKSSMVEIEPDLAALLDAFRQIRRWYILRDLQNPDAGIFPEDFWVEFFTQKLGEQEEILTGDDVSLTVKRFGKIFLRAMAGNRSEKNLYLSLFHLGENFSITPLGNQMFKAGEETDFFFETGSQYVLSVSPGNNDENLTIQTIITAEKIDHYALQQNGLLRIPSQTSSTR